MLVPLVILAVGALLAGVMNLPFDLGLSKNALGEFLGQSPSFRLAYEVAARGVEGDHLDTLKTHFGQQAGESHGVNVLPLIIGAIVSIAGIALAYLNHLADRDRGEAFARKAWTLSAVLEHKYWIDPIYHGLIVMPLRAAGSILSAIDRFVIDGIVSTIALAQWLGGFSMRATTQRGYLQGYALTAVLGVAVILVVVFVF